MPANRRGPARPPCPGDNVSRVALFLNGLVMTMIGLRGLFGPEAFLGEFGVVLPTPTALGEARAAHGGVFGALAVLVWLGLFRPDFRITALRVAAFVMLGLAVGRVLAFFVDGATESQSVIATVAEIVLGGLAFAGLTREGTNAASDG